MTPEQLAILGGLWVTILIGYSAITQLRSAAARTVLMLVVTAIGIAVTLSFEAPQAEVARLVHGVAEWGRSRDGRVGGSNSTSKANPSRRASLTAREEPRPDKARTPDAAPSHTAAASRPATLVYGGGAQSFGYESGTIPRGTFIDDVVAWN